MLDVRSPQAPSVIASTSGVRATHDAREGSPAFEVVAAIGAGLAAFTMMAASVVVYVVH